MKYILSLILAIISVSTYAQQPCTAPERLYKEDSLYKVYTSFIDSLNPSSLVLDYPKAIEYLLSVEVENQVRGIRILGETESPDILPWLIMKLDSKHTEVKVQAFFAIEQLVVNSILKHRASNSKSAIRVDYSALSWLILKHLRHYDNHPNESGYAATMAGYLKLKIFQAEVEELLNSKHPAVVNSAKYALIELTDEDER